MSIRELAQAALTHYPYGTAAVDPRTGVIEASGSGFGAYKQRLRGFQRYQDGGCPRPSLLFHGVALTETNESTRSNEDKKAFQPRTALGSKLLALRSAYRDAGGPILGGWDEIDAEVEARRGGVRESGE